MKCVVHIQCDLALGIHVAKSFARHVICDGSFALFEFRSVNVTMASPEDTHLCNVWSVYVRVCLNLEQWLLCEASSGA